MPLPIAAYAARPSPARGADAALAGRLSSSVRRASSTRPDRRRAATRANSTRSRWARLPPIRSCEAMTGTRSAITRLPLRGRRLQKPPQDLRPPVPPDPRPDQTLQRPHCRPSRGPVRRGHRRRRDPAWETPSPQMTQPTAEVGTRRLPANSARNRNAAVSVSTLIGGPRLRQAAHPPQSPTTPCPSALLHRPEGHVPGDVAVERCRLVVTRAPIVDVGGPLRSLRPHSGRAPGYGRRWHWGFMAKERSMVASAFVVCPASTSAKAGRIGTTNHATMRRERP